MNVFAALALSAVLAPSPAPEGLPSPHPLPTATASAAPTASPKPSPSPTPKTPYDAMQWREVGPAASGGRVAAVAGSVTDPNLYYFGAAGGGVWKSDNGGVTW